MDVSVFCQRQASLSGVAFEFELVTKMDFSGKFVFRV